MCQYSCNSSGTLHRSSELCWCVHWQCASCNASFGQSSFHRCDSWMDGRWRDPLDNYCQPFSLRTNKEFIQSLWVDGPDGPSAVKKRLWKVILMYLISVPRIQFPTKKLNFFGNGTWDTVSYIRRGKGGQNWQFFSNVQQMYSHLQRTWVGNAQCLERSEGHTPRDAAFKA